jgi:hypothetical protein
MGQEKSAAVAAEQDRKKATRKIHLLRCLYEKVIKIFPPVLRCRVTARMDSAIEQQFPCDQKQGAEPPYIVRAKKALPTLPD